MECVRRVLEYLFQFYLCAPGLLHSVHPNTVNESGWDVRRRTLWELKYSCRHICSCGCTSAKQHLLEAGLFFQVRDESMREVDAMFVKAHNVFMTLIHICCWLFFFSSRIFKCPLKLIGLFIIKISGAII